LLWKNRTLITQYAVTVITVGINFLKVGDSYGKRGVQAYNGGLPAESRDRALIRGAKKKYYCISVWNHFIVHNTFTKGGLET